MLIASDAIGMGLNLRIQRIIFASLSKFDGTTVRPLAPTEVKQIAGRAGRYSSNLGAGEVTCLHDGDLPLLRRTLSAPLSPLTKSGLAPTFEQLELFDRASGHSMSFAELLMAFEESARLSERHFCCALEPMARLAEIIECADGLGLYERHVLCQAPLDPRDTLHANLLRSWARELANGKPARLRYAPPERPPRSHAELQSLESYFRALDGYLWLALRFAESFSHTEKAHSYRDACAAMIEAALDDLPPLEGGSDGGGGHSQRERGRVAARELANRKRSGGSSSDAEARRR